MNKDIDDLTWKISMRANPGIAFDYAKRLAALAITPYPAKAVIDSARSLRARAFAELIRREGRAA